MGAAQTAAQALLGVGKVVLDGVIGTLHEGLCPARAIAHDRVPAQLLAVAFQVAQHDGFRLVGEQPHAEARLTRVRLELTELEAPDGTLNYAGMGDGTRDLVPLKE